MDIHSAFQLTADAHTSKDALRFIDGTVWTFQDLVRGVAWVEHLYLCNVKQREVVGVCMDASPELIVVYLACMKRGAVFCPMDSFSQATIDAFAVSTMLVCDNLDGESPPAGIATVPVKLPLVEVSRGMEPPLPRCAGDRRVVQADMAHLIFTSGSSGMPKGVLCDHWGSINSHSARAACVPFQAGDLTGCNLFGIWDAMWTLLAGFPVLMIPNRAMKDPDLLVEILGEHQISRIMLTPSLLGQLLILPGFSNCACLEVITLCGEVTRDQLVNEAFARLANPQLKLVNLYSLSECHDVAISVVDRTSGNLGEFAVLSGVDAHILDEELEPVPDGEWGVLHIGGPTLATKYVGASAQSRDAFHIWHGTRLFNSNDRCRMSAAPRRVLQVAGRVGDADEINVRGFRVSLSSIEAAAMDVRQRNGVYPVSCCAVGVALEESPTLSDLVLCVVLANDGSGAGTKPPTPDPLVDPRRAALWVDLARNALRKKLPSHAVPNRIELFDTLPLKPGSGKRNKATLQSMVRERFAARRQRAHTEPSASNKHELLQFVIEAFRDITHSDAVDEHTDFFVAGGHSLAVIQLLQILRKRLPRMTMREFLTAPTPSGLVDGRDSPAPERIDVGNTYQRWHDDNLRSLTFAENDVDVSMRVAFVTGATGFVGSHLVAELMRGTKTDKVYCLVRRPDVKTAGDLVELWHKTYGSIVDSSALLERCASRVVIVHGDLRQTMLGIADSVVLHEVSTAVDVVYHCAAKLDMVASFAAHEGHNVAGTAHVLQLCARCMRNPYLVYVSTSSVFPPVGSPHCTPDASWSETWGRLPLSWGGSMHTESIYHGTYEGYVQSKWVAEQLVWDAFQNGARGCVVRPSVIAPSSVENFSLSHGFHSMMLLEAFQVSVLELGRVPAAREMDQRTISCISVDELCRLMVHVSSPDRQQDCNHGAVHASEEIRLGWISQRLRTHIPRLGEETFGDWRDEIKTRLVRDSARWRVVFDTPFGFEGLLGECEVPLCGTRLDTFRRSAGGGDTMTTTLDRVVSCICRGKVG